MKGSLSVWIAKILRLTPPAILTAATFVLCAGMVGGFDFTDEGVYYLGFSNPHDVPDSNTSYRFFGAQIFALLGKNIVAMRFFTLVGMAASTLVFLKGWRRVTEQFAPGTTSNPEEFRLTRHAVLIASILGFAISPVALSYNFQNAFCLLAACGFLFYAATTPPDNRLLDPAALVPLMAFGVMTGLQFFVKFSSSVILAGVGSVFFLTLSRKTFAQKVTLSAVSLVFAIVVGLSYFVFYQSFSRWWTGISGIARLVAQRSYTFGQIERYLSEFSVIAVQATLLAWTVGLPTLLGMLACWKLPRWQKPIATVTAMVVVATTASMAGDLDYSSALGSIGISLYFSGLILLALLAVASCMLRPPSGSTLGEWRLVFSGLFLFVVPYIGSFGTSNDINQNCLYQMAPWFALASLLLIQIDRCWNSRWFHRTGVTILAVTAGIQFYQGYWVRPYRVTGRRTEQRVPTAIGDPSTRLLLSPATHDFVVTAQRCLQEHGFKKGDELLVFFDLPGFVFAMGGSSPGHHWYFAGDQAALEDSAMHVRLLDPKHRGRAFIVRNSNTDWDAFLPHLRAAGVPFPEGYRLITPPMNSPFTGVKFEIWQPVAKTTP